MSEVLTIETRRVPMHIIAAIIVPTIHIETLLKLLNKDTEFNLIKTDIHECIITMSTDTSRFVHYTVAVSSKELKDKIEAMYKEKRKEAGIERKQKSFTVKMEEPPKITKILDAEVIVGSREDLRELISGAKITNPDDKPFFSAPLKKIIITPNYIEYKKREKWYWSWFVHEQNHYRAPSRWLYLLRGY